MLSEESMYQTAFFSLRRDCKEGGERERAVRREKGGATIEKKGGKGRGREGLAV